ncbi:MAG: hypothetical protein CMP22_07685 [Rickettsiales bacterium]|nr:hypothetical protein [Rickettsiales bacterium]|tara:strand:- start:1802 stop:1981 length:180 start_codon:yes stop_codon:yes gene_type:complete
MNNTSNIIQFPQSTIPVGETVSADSDLSTLIGECEPTIDMAGILMDLVFEAMEGGQSHD